MSTGKNIIVSHEQSVKFIDIYSVSKSLAARLKNQLNIHCFCITYLLFWDMPSHENQQQNRKHHRHKLKQLYSVLISSFNIMLIAYFKSKGGCA